MSFQGLAVACIVAACTTYVVWKLMPMAARRGLTAWLLKRPVPEVLARRLRAAAAAAADCGCDTCDRAPQPPAAGSTQTVRWHRRSPP